MKTLVLAALAVALALPLRAEPDPVLRLDYSNPGLTPAQWTLVIHSNGSGHFHAVRGNAPASPDDTIEPLTIDRDIHLSNSYADQIFQTLRHHPLQDGTCESRSKVAFQGWKKMAYSGPGGPAACAFNYAKDKDIQALSESLIAVASTLIEGARMELILQHDPLGLDKEMEFVSQAASDGRLQQLCAIHEILERLQDDPGVMERVRKRAGQLARLNK